MHNYIKEQLKDKQSPKQIQNYSELLAMNMKPAIIVVNEKDITPELIDIVYEDSLFLIIR